MTFRFIFLGTLLCIYLLYLFLTPVCASVCKCTDNTQVFHLDLC